MSPAISGLRSHSHTISTIRQATPNRVPGLTTLAPNLSNVMTVLVMSGLRITRTRKMPISRRGFFASTAAVGCSGLLSEDCEASQQEAARAAQSRTDRRPLIVSTWPFGKAANERALRTIEGGASTLDGVEQGIRLTEADAGNASVGIGGTPNADGVVQLDACIMEGPGHKAGSVAALEGILHPISVARRVMEKSPHVMLVGEGARQFALAEGMEPGQLLTDAQRRKWQEWKSEQSAQRQDGDAPTGHDTISLLALGTDGNLAGGCSTSGLGFKLPGRVGDSPILGSGLYVDNEVGAAGATGIGENVMRYCASFLIVEMMRAGEAPETACVETIRRIAKSDPRGFDLSINFVAMDRRGRYGAAGTGDGFAYSVTMPGYSEVLRSAAVQN